MVWKKFKDEILQLNGTQRVFIFCAMICGFCITADYGIVRPVSNSIFLTAHGSDLFPYAWLSIVPLNFLLVALYNKYLPRIGVQKMFFTIISTVAVVNIFCAVFMTKIPFLPFFFYVWKEIYVMLLFQQLWSVIHSTIQMQQAKYLYGLLFAFGGLGGIFGSIMPSYLAVSMGSSNVIFTSMPLFLLLTFAFTYLLKYSAVHKEAETEAQKPITNFWQGVGVIRNSKYLFFILMIVLLMQVTTSLVYYQFNTIIESAMPQQDIRTEYCGKIFGVVNIMTVFFQAFGSFLVLHFFGLRGSHLLLPVILSLNAIGSLIAPTFGMLSIAFITIKAFDFSLFGVLKEMLYIPLKQEEKFHAKAIIDVFVYRSSKAIAACYILILQAMGYIDLVHCMSWGSFALLIVWCLVVYKMFQLKEEAPAATAKAEIVKPEIES
jgi:AAA family ATP:ADP antiporter